MALLELGGKAFPISVGELVLGSDAGCGIVVSGSSVLPKHALFQGQPDGQVVIRKATPAAEVLINGVRLGAEPTPLLHGDKLEIGGHELNFVDERRSGSTQFLHAVKVPEAMGQPKAGAQTGVTANTGGRLVSLTDGREYVISGASLVFGREAACDVVVGGKDVSRRHAEIVQTPKGYLIVDSSTNGTFVNEERVRGQRILTRADVVRIGDDNFRFYADLVPATSPAPAPAAPPKSPPAGGQRPSQTGPLAVLVVKGGALKGQRVEVRTPVVNIGRADYNDVPLADPSVSTSHAKLQRREGIWVLQDLDSTNGSFVDGERVRGEIPIGPGTSVKFGDVELSFEPTDDAMGVGKGGGTVVMASFTPMPPSPPTAAAPAPPPAPPAPPVRRASPPPANAPSKAGSPAPAAARGPKRSPTPAPPPKAAQKQGRGCGAGVVVLLAGAGGMAAVVYWVLA
jgi:pSer/pThr/pTyr-binding forkhead associated (FHA) protein